MATTCLQHRFFLTHTQVWLLSATRKGDRPPFSGQSWVFPNPFWECSLDSSLSKKPNKMRSAPAPFSALSARSCGFAQGPRGGKGLGLSPGNSCPPLHLCVGRVLVTCCVHGRRDEERNLQRMSWGRGASSRHLTVTLAWITPLRGIYASTPSSSFLQLDVI